MELNKSTLNPEQIKTIVDQIDQMKASGKYDEIKDYIEYVKNQSAASQIGEQIGIGVQELRAGMNDIVGDRTDAQLIREDIRRYEEPRESTGVTNEAIKGYRYVPDMAAGLGVGSLGLKALQSTKAGMDILRNYGNLNKAKQTLLGMNAAGTGNVTSGYAHGDLRGTKDTSVGIQDRVDPAIAAEAYAMGAGFPFLVNAPLNAVNAASKKALKTKIDSDIRKSDGKATVSNEAMKKFMRSNGETVSENNGIKKIKVNKGDESIYVFDDGENIYVNFKDKNNSVSILQDLAYKEANKSAIISPLKENKNIFDDVESKYHETIDSKKSVYDDIERNISNTYQETDMFKSRKEASEYWYNKQEENNWSNKQLNDEIKKVLKEKDTTREAQFKNEDVDTGTKTSAEDIKYQSVEELSNKVNTSEQKAYGAKFSQEIKNVDQDLYVNNQYKPKNKLEQEVQQKIKDFSKLLKEKKPSMDKNEFNNRVMRFSADLQDMTTKTNMTKSEFMDMVDQSISSKLNEVEKNQSMHEAITPEKEYDFDTGEYKNVKKQEVSEDTQPKFDAIKKINEVFGSKKNKGKLGELRDFVSTFVKKDDNGKYTFKKMDKKDSYKMKQFIFENFTYGDKVPVKGSKKGKPVKKWLSNDKIYSEIDEKQLNYAIAKAEQGDYRALNKFIKSEKFKRPSVDTNKKFNQTPEDYIAKKYKKEKIEPSKTEDIAKKNIQEKAESTTIKDVNIKQAKDSKYYTGKNKVDSSDDPTVENISGKDGFGEYDKEINNIIMQEGLSGKDSNAYKYAIIHEYLHSRFKDLSDAQMKQVVDNIKTLFTDPETGKLTSEYLKKLDKHIESTKQTFIDAAERRRENILKENISVKEINDKVKELYDDLDKRIEEFYKRDVYEEVLTYTFAKDILKEFDGSDNFKIVGKQINEGQVREVVQQMPDMDMKVLYDNLPDYIKDKLDFTIVNLYDNPNSILYRAMHQDEFAEKMISENKGFFKAVGDNSKIAKKGFDSIRDYLDDASWSGWLSVNAEHSAMMKLAGKIKGYHATENESLAELHKEIRNTIETKFKDIKDADNVLGQMQYQGLMELKYFFPDESFDDIVKKIQDNTFFNKEDIDIASMNYIESIINQYSNKLDESSRDALVLKIVKKLGDKGSYKTKKGKKVYTAAKMSELIEALVKGKGGSVYSTKAYGKNKKYNKIKTRNYINTSSNLDMYVQKIMRSEIEKELNIVKDMKQKYQVNSEFVDFIDRQIAIRRFSSEMKKPNSYVYKNLDKFKKVYENKHFDMLVDQNKKMTNALKANGNESNMFGINAHPEYQNSGYKWIISDKVPKEAIASGEKIYGNSRFVLVPDNDVVLGKQEGILPKGYTSNFEKGIDTVSDVFMYDSKYNSFYRYENGKKKFLNKNSKTMITNVKDLHGGKYQIQFKIPENSKRRVRSSEGFANIYNYSFSDMYTRNQYLLNQSIMKQKLREKYIRDAQIYGLLLTDESFASVNNPNRYVKVFSENGKDYYAKKKWVAQFRGTNGLEVRNKYAKFVAKTATGLVDLVRNNIIIGSASAFINSYVASTGTFMLHSNNKMGVIGAMSSAKKEISDYLTLLNKYGAELSKGKNIDAIKKELNDNDVYQAFSRGLQSTIRESNLILGINKRNDIHNMISQYFGVSKGFMDVMETIHLRPNTRLGTSLGNAFDITEIVPKYALYKERLKKTGDHDMAIDYVNNAFPNYSMNLPEGISALDEVVPFMKFFMSVPKMVHFGLIESPTSFAIMKAATLGMILGSYKVFGEDDSDEWFKDNNFTKIGDSTYYYTESLSNYNFSTPSPFGVNALERIYAPIDIMPLTFKE